MYIADTNVAMTDISNQNTDEHDKNMSNGINVTFTLGETESTDKANNANVHKSTETVDLHRITDSGSENWDSHKEDHGTGIQTQSETGLHKTFTFSRIDRYGSYSPPWLSCVFKISV